MRISRRMLRRVAVVAVFRYVGRGKDKTRSNESGRQARSMLVNRTDSGREYEGT
jgi:hypothetical protein